MDKWRVGVGLTKGIKMSEEYELMAELNILCDKLSVSGKQMAKYGQEKAQAEHDYKIALRQEALRLRTTEDMPVTLIDKVVYGTPEVAEKRFKRDVAETMYETCRESINVLKLKVRILDAQIAREWGNAK